MNASWLWARVDLRRRWRAVVVLTVLAGLAGAFAVTALVGAQRTATAWERFRAETLADDAFVSIPSRPEPEVADELAAMTGVIDAASFVYLAVTLPGVPERCLRGHGRETDADGAEGPPGDGVGQAAIRPGRGGRATYRPARVGGHTTSEIKNLRLVGSSPWVVAAFLAALGAAADGHALVVSVRAGRRDLAVLRALGFVRGQVQAAVRWQAPAMVAIGLVAGLPLGVGVGRWVWRLAVRSTGALVEPVMAAAFLAAIVPVAVVLANLAAAIPARAAGRMRPAEVLRTE